VFTGDLSLEQVSLALDADQYNGFLNTLDYMTNFQKYEMFRGLKPNAGFSTPQERTKWWNFAFNALKHEFDGSHFTWDQIEQRKLKREEYIPLFKKTLKAPWLKSPTNIELDRLKKLEEEIDFETIVVCREIARDEIHAEKRERDRKFALEMQQRQSPMKQSAPTTPPKQSTSSWFSRFTKKLERKTDDTTSDTGTFDDEMSDTGVHMTDQEQQDLIDLIGFDDDTLLNRSNDWVMFQLNVVLDGGAIELINNKSNSAIVKGVYKKLEAAIGIREAARGVLVDISLGDFFIEDMYSEATMFKKIMMRHVEHDGPLVAVKIEVNPVDGRSDLFVDVKLERTDLVFNAPLVQVSIRTHFNTY
jgi:vacuolar protein sorting-associated protein 13A/C